MFERYNFNDGEGIDFADFTAMQKSSYTFLQDMVLREMAMHRSNPGNLNQVALNTAPDYAATSQIFALGEGGACIPSPTTKTVSFVGGMIATIGAGSPDGSTAVCLAANCNIPPSTRAPSAAGNRRWDILCVKLDEVVSGSTRDFESAATRAKTSQVFTNKTTETVITSQWVLGTETSGTPSEPATPVGFKKLCAVYVDDTTNPFNPVDGDNPEMRDYRMPFGVSAGAPGLAGVFAYSANGGSTAFTGGIGGASPTAIMATNGGSERAEAWHSCPDSSERKRVHSFEIFGNVTVGTASDSQLRLRAATNGIVSDTTVFADVTLSTNAADQNFVIYPVIPMWANGWPAGVAAGRHANYRPRGCHLWHRIDSVVHTFQYKWVRWNLKG